MAQPSNAARPCPDCQGERTAETAYLVGYRADGSPRYATRCKRCHVAYYAANSDRQKRVEAKRRQRRRAGAVPLAERPPRETCQSGHPLDGLHHGRRRCLTCHREKARARARAAGVKPQSPRTHCPQGHALTTDNVRSGRHRGACLLCHRLRQHREYDRVAREYVAVIVRDPCVYCGGRGGTVDHIVAIANGGSDDWTNLTAACHSCNSRKRTIPLLSFLLRRSDAM